MKAQGVWYEVTGRTTIQKECTKQIPSLESLSRVAIAEREGWGGFYEGKR
jgi:hypothetical protein